MKNATAIVVAIKRRQRNKAHAAPVLLPAFLKICVNGKDR